MSEMSYEDSDLVGKLSDLKKNAPKMFEDAAIEAGLKLMEWSTFGSPRDPVKSPIDEGDLRYDSVFLKVGRKKLRING